MLMRTFTLLLLLSLALATALDSTDPPPPSSSTIEALILSSSAQPVKEEQLPAMAPPSSSELPILLPPSLPEETLRRRIVTYDQRQEGQYNIRADLENFMIVLIPPGPQEGLSLLDLLTNPSLTSPSRRGGSHSQSHASKGKRKHYATRNALKEGPFSLKSFYQRQRQQQQRAEAQAEAQAEPQRSLLSERPDFIEGRTPYHVDISASDDEQARLHPERQQVDVLPPPYYPQLIKPFHLEAEPTLIQALPPASNSHYYRNSRHLRGDSYLDTNRLAGEASVGSNARAISVPIYRAELSNQANALYPPIDTPAYFLADAQAHSWRLDDEPTPVLPPKPLMETDVLSFELLGDTLADSKTLLRDGLARCAPGQRRDSYGVCREIEGY